MDMVQLNVSLLFRQL